MNLSPSHGKRALTAGTIVYGFAAQSRITRTVRGIPDMQSVGDDDYRKINLELTWCAPVRDPMPTNEAPKLLVKTAGLRHASRTARSAIIQLSLICSPPLRLQAFLIVRPHHPTMARRPLQRSDETAFDAPLRVDYIYQGWDAEFISLQEEIYFGAELTNSRPNKVYAPSGVVAVEVAGMQAELTAAENGGLNVRSTGNFVVGSSPILKWDQNAFFRQQLQKMGMRTQDGESDAETGAAEGALGRAN